MQGFILFLVLVVVIVCCAITYTLLYNTRIVKVDSSQVFNFKNALDLVKVPIITFHQGKNKYNFLIDTGSSVSYLNGSTIIEHTPTGDTDSFIGAEGVRKGCTLSNINLYYSDKCYNHLFRISDLDAAFNEVKKETGVQIHGIIGSDFMEKYKYCIDFKEFVVYKRK